MSLRDIAAAIGASTSNLCDYMAIAHIPSDQFEQALQSDKRPSTSSLAALGRKTPVPARGRVKRAFAIYKGMTPAERGEFLAQIGGAA
jgi:hypothetical protein